MGKNIVICCDGTRNKPSLHNTNVVKLFSLVEKTANQVVYYDPGVGSLSQGLLRAYQGVTGLGLSENIKEAYVFLMNNYKVGDKVFLFGFSRGAYTVRCLAGILYRIGLLQKGNYNLIDYAILQYFDREDPEVTPEFKKSFSRKCEVHFVGVWDTVGAFIPYPPSHKFHNNYLNRHIPFGYQALAIDEKRTDFKPEIWDIYPESVLQDDGLTQTIEQVWFAGVHSDVGGSNPSDGLSDISLKWMIMKAKVQGLITCPQSELDKEINDNIDDKIYESRTGIWKLRPEYKRIIKENSLIHHTVLDRIMGRVDGYSPKNLPHNPAEILAKFKIVDKLGTIEEISTSDILPLR
jgi:uncharacterized protein (DUF2235 family)